MPGPDLDTVGPVPTVHFIEPASVVGNGLVATFAELPFAGEVGDWTVPGQTELEVHHSRVEGVR
jgi:hypothetical protein